MRYLMMYRPAVSHEGCAPPTPEKMEEMGRYVEEQIKAGILVTTGGLLPSAAGAKVRLSNGKITVTDGPFTEAKELIGGFAICELKSKAEAIESAKSFLKIAGDGETEIRQMHEQPDCAP